MSLVVAIVAVVVGVVAGGHGGCSLLVVSAYVWRARAMVNASEWCECECGR